MAKLVKSENPDGTSTIKVGKGGKVVTSSGKTATGGKIVGKLPKTKTPADMPDLDVEEYGDVFDDVWVEDSVDDYDDILNPEDENISEEYIYVTRDGVVGDAAYDKLQIVDTTGVSEDDLGDLAYADYDEREELAETLRKRNAVPTQHYFNSTGEYGLVRDLKILNTADLTKSELNKIYSSSDPFDEAENHDTHPHTVLGKSNGNHDVKRNNGFILNGTSY